MQAKIFKQFGKLFGWSKKEIQKTIKSNQLLNEQKMANSPD